MRRITIKTVRDPISKDGKSAPLPPAGAAKPKQKWIVYLLVTLATISSVNILGGDFVYDDKLQIVNNHFIKQSRYFGQALSSDVWAFKGDTGQSWSNYWRPGFVTWLILNCSIFGVKSSFGWHLTNLILHVGCVVLVYQTLVRLGSSNRIAAAMSCIFAVHPVHVEVVAWISGSTDMLMTLGLLGSLMFLFSGSESDRNEKWPWALGCYLFALFSKETAILFPIVIFTIWLLRQPKPMSFGGIGVAVKKTTPFIAVLMLYLALRIAALGFVQRPFDSDVSTLDMLMTWPTVALFYVRQIFFPVWIGPSYPIRIVQEASLDGFWIPLILFLAIGLVMLWAARSNRISAIGLVLFVFTLAPAMNLRVFSPEQMVHDRYLYLPLMGALMVFIPPLATILNRWSGNQGERVENAIFGIALIACIPMMFQTLRYNRAYANEVSLWAWGVQSDPQSMFNYTQYGVALAEAGRADEALLALNRAIELLPLPDAYQPNAYLQRSEIYTDQQRFEKAEQDLNAVLQKYPADYRAFERLALVRIRQNRPEDAEKILREAREKIPYRKGELTEKIAIVLYQQGKIDLALEELEAYQDISREEPGPRAKLTLYRLGLIYLQQGRSADARKLFQEFLDLTSGAQDLSTATARKDVVVRLQKMDRR